MKVGLPKEIKDQEARVAITPKGVKQLVQAGHSVYVEADAGLASGFINTDYQAAGGMLVSTAEAWNVDLVIKVKEPQPSEYLYLGTQILFTFLHLSGVNKQLTETLIKQGTTALAYESLEDEHGRLPILAPMSAIAGNMAVSMGAYYLASFNQGNGMQLGCILNKSYGKVLIIGDGVVGQHAAKVASAMGAHVYVAGRHKEKWPVLQAQGLSQVQFLQLTQENIAQQIVDADLVIGALLSRGAKAPKIISEAMIKTMPKGSVLVDVSIDQGGCFETSIPTTHSDPVFTKYDVIHYCVANMPGAYPKASTLALTDITIQYILELAEQGVTNFLTDEHKVKAINIYKGQLVTETVAKDLSCLDLFQPLELVLNK